MDAADSGSSDNGLPEEFIPDKELVRRELARAGGYMWQGSIAGEIGWSSAKTSRVLCAMERNERVCRRQIGRRKIVCLPDQEPWFLEPAGRAYPERERAIVGTATDD